MNDVQFATVIRCVRQSEASRGADRSDAELLHDFTMRDDQTAFDQLVRRHGGLVLGACRRVLEHAQDAEDAFQATFLVLARKAGTIRRKESLASWLHGVSYRIAMKAKRDAARRRKHEAQAAGTCAASPDTDLAWREVQAVLDEEVEKLPPIYRDAFVLCCLEGLSHAEASENLGVKEGTVSSRLTQARKRLRDTLAQRGITLSAVMSALTLSKALRAQVPAALRESTTQAAAAYVAGTVQGLPAKALSLAEGAIRTMLTTKVKLATVLLLTLSMLGIGASVLPFHSASAKESTTRRPQEKGNRVESTPFPVVANDAQPEATPVEPITVIGTVLGPDAKPVANASVAVWASSKRVKGIAANKDGKFEMTLALDQLKRPVYLVASTERLGTDWRILTAAPTKKLTLRLPKDDLPIEGRLVDLEGKPVAGATVEVTRFAKRRERGNLDAWLKQYKESVHATDDFRGVRSRAIGRFTKVKADAEGRFRLRAHGRGRILNLNVRGTGVEHLFIQVLVHPGPTKGWRPGGWGLYPAKHSVVMAPAKLIVGTVRDAKSKKPIPGIRVIAGPSNQATVKTDRDGRFRVEGVAKSREYWLSAGGEVGLPYFDRTRHRIQDTPGFEPLQVDVELERGIEIKGRVIDKKTRKPVKGRVSWHAATDNPNQKDFASLSGARMIVSDYGNVQPDGSFTLLAIPGSGAIGVRATSENGYVRQIPPNLKLGNLILEYYHKLVPIVVDPKKRESLNRTLELEPGRIVTAELTDPAGKPLVGTFAAGNFAVMTSFGRTEALKHAGVQIGGLDARSRKVLFVHPKRKLAKMLTVDPSTPQSIKVRLDKPTAVLAGRIVTGDKRVPRPGVKVTAAPTRRYRLYGKELPMDLLVGSRTWSPMLQVEAVTDAKGRFELKGLLPGMKYWIYWGMSGQLYGGKFDAVAVEADKTIDLGDLSTTQVDKDGSTGKQ